MTLSTPAAAVFLIAAMSSLLTGCSEAPRFADVTATSTPTADGGSTLRGILHGGQQPIVGAKIYLLAAGTTGYSSPATSLLTSASYPNYATQQDGSSRWYATTDAGGNFQIVDNCTPGQQVYVASIGGNPGAGTNSAATELALLGTCPSAGNFDSTLTGVFISEISTVAAAYATAAYAKDSFDIGAPNTTGAQQGIANAFANANNLFDVQNLNDLARVTTPGGNGTVAQAKIHTIANILAACINSTGPGSGQCAQLFTYAVPPGTGGTAPTDVATAAMNLAHNPSVSPSSLITLQTPNSPFFPQIKTTMSDFSLAIDFAGAALGSNPSLAVDGTGNVWSLVPGQSAVAKLSPMGVLLSGASGYALGAGFANSKALAFDTSNNLWVLGSGTYGVGTNATYAELSSTGVYQKMVTQPGTTVVTTPLEVGVNPPSTSTNLVLDGAGNFFYSSSYALQVFGTSVTIGNCCTAKYNMASGTVTNLDNGNMTSGTNFVAVGSSAWATSAGSKLSFTTTSSSKGLTGGGLSAALGVALDSAGSAWVADSGNSSVSKFSNAGAVMSSSSGFTGGLSTPKAIAVDGAGTVWVTNSVGSYVLTPFTSAGAVVGNGYVDANLGSAGNFVLDSSGDAWVASTSSSTVTEFLGIAAPVVTPMSAAIAGGMLGTRP